MATRGKDRPAYTRAELARLAQANDLLLAFHEVGRVFHANLDLPPLCQAVCDRLAQHRRYTTVWIDRLGGSAATRTLLGLAGRDLTQLPKEIHSWTELALSEGHPLISPDVNADERFTATEPTAGPASVALFPLSEGGRQLGVLGVWQIGPEAFDETEVQLLTDLAADLTNIWSRQEQSAEQEQIRENLEVLVEALPDAVFFKDGGGRWLVLNQPAKALFRVENRPWRYRTDRELAEDLPELRSAHLACLESDEAAWQAGRMVVSQEEILNEAGRISNFEVFKLPLFHADGRRKGLVVLGRDITDRLLASQRLEVAGARLAQLNRELEQRVEERTRQLADSEEMFRTIAASVNSAIFLINPEGQISFWNRAAEQITGWSAGDVLGRDIIPLLGLPGNLWTCLPPTSPRRQIFVVERPQVEVSARRRDDTVFPLELALTLVWLRGRPHIVGLGHDISGRRRAEQELERYAWEVEDLYNRAPCGYHSLDANGVIIQINHTELNWLGYTREQMIGRKLSDFFTPASQETFATQFLAFTGKDRIGDLEMELVRRDGSILPVVLHSVAVRDATGRFLRTRTSIFDNTERRKVEQQLHRALALAAAANRAKTDFLATMSHEIRTPMNAIMGYAQLLRRQPDLPESARTQADIIVRNGQNLLSLLNSILELSQIEEGRVAMNPEVFSPRELGVELLVLFRETAQSKGLELTFTPATDLPAAVEADQDKLRRALANLLSNAVKFTQSGRVELLLSTTGCVNGQWQLVAEVRDTGPGIPAEELSRLFHRFAQTSIGRRTGNGTGLGLYISNQYARLLGGSLTVQSSPGTGSVFRLEWPAQSAAATLAAPHGDRLPVLPADAPPCRVLVVDDVLDNRKLLAELLLRAGFLVHLAADGHEALTAVAEWSPHLVLMDAHMPGLDGGEATRQLRARGGSLPLKIIIVSAAAFEWNRQAALAAGADDFIAKPYRDRDLLEKIREHLGLTFQTDPTLGSSNSTSGMNATELEQLGSAVLRDLHDTVLTADYDQLRRRLAALREKAPVTVGYLEKLAAQFDAETLLRELAR